MADKPLSETETFREAMGDVEPLIQTARVTLKPESDANSKNMQKLRREAATEVQQTQMNELSGEYIEPVDPNEILTFQRPGVQHGVFKNLRLGKYSIEARLDLHRHTVEQARVAVYTFVNDCLANDIRCALITPVSYTQRTLPTKRIVYISVVAVTIIQQASTGMCTVTT